MKQDNNSNIFIKVKNEMSNITTRKIETVISMEAANMIGKEHFKLLRDIRRYIKQF